jgi:hypothetical protein
MRRLASLFVLALVLGAVVSGGCGGGDSPSCVGEGDPCDFDAQCCPGLTCVLSKPDVCAVSALTAVPDSR